MGDNISRQAAIDEIQPFGEYESNMTNKEWVRRFTVVLKQLPSTDPWIPCSERLPDKDGEYIVTQKNGSIGRYVFSCEGNSEEYFKRCAIAWMPLPEPYKGGEKWEFI